METKDTTLYEKVAARITGLIQARTLRPGDKIPSIRKCSKMEKVSLSTVLQAYLLLEERGWIEARPQSGYYVRLHPRRLPPEPEISSPPMSATQVSVSDLVFRIQEAIAKPDIVPFGGAIPDPHLLPVRRLNRAMAIVARRSSGIDHLYGPIPGNEELRRQIARRAVDSGCSLTAGDLVVTFGCMEAIQLCLRAVASPGDTIAVESPTYYAFLQMLESLRMKVIEIPTDPGKGVSLDALQLALRKNKIRACLFVTNFNNPLGSRMPDSKKKTLVELLAKREIPLIEDDIYGDLHFAKHRPGVCKAYDKRGLVLLCSSFSKVLSPGYRVGWTAPGRFYQEILRLKFTSTYTTATPTQMAIAEFIRNGGYDYHLRRIRKAYSDQVQSVIQAISKYFPSGTRVTRPQGGFVVWVELPESTDAMDLYEKALKEKISIVPGTIFSAKKQFRNFIRLNCAHAWTEKSEQALFVLGRLARE